MKLAALALAAAMTLVAGGARAGPAERCFWVHGRLFAMNGAPTFRIGVSGTRRILGVVDAQGGSEAPDLLPDNLRALVMPDAFKVEVTGDFQVCPQARDQPARMRPVRLMAARRVERHPTQGP